MKIVRHAVYTSMRHGNELGISESQISLKARGFKHLFHSVLS